jgi:hypothetical protein
MARKPRCKQATDLQPNNSLVIEQADDETGAQAMARKLLQPAFKNAVAASTFMGKMLGTGDEMPGIHDYATAVLLTAKGSAEGDLGMASQILASHALSLDAMFAEFARRSAINMGDYINASERYGRLALKAQGNCRATLETLAKLHQPREQTVRHVHVNEGGQAVVADHFHQHTGGRKIGKTIKQSDATGAAGASSALPCSDPIGNGVPIPGGEREGAMQDARRQKSRRTQGQP